MKKLRYLKIILFFLIIGFFLVNMNTESNQISEIDNRVLQEKPNLKNFEDVTENLESYLSDRIGYRNEMINMYTKANDGLFNLMVHPTYTYGEEGYVFFKMASEIDSTEFMESFSRFLVKLQEYSEERGITFLYALNPNKATIYEEFLPKGVNIKNNNTKTLLRLLDEKKVNHIYTAQALKEAKETEQVFNVKYDAGHWNDTGAYIGIKEIFSALKKDYPDLTMKDRENFKIKKEIADSLPVSFFSIHEEIDTFVPKENEAVKDDSFDGEIRLNKNHTYFERYINKENPEAPKILIFRGSYFNGKSKFIMDSFSESTFVHNYYNVIDYHYYINIFQPDIVVFETAEYATVNKYFPRELIDNVEYNIPYERYKNLPQKEFSIISNSTAIEKNTSGNLTQVNFSIEGEEVSSAYSIVGDVIYDMTLIKSDRGYELSVTYNNKDLIQGQTGNIILIDKEGRYQNIIPVDIE